MKEGNHLASPWGLSTVQNEFHLNSSEASWISSIKLNRLTFHLSPLNACKHSIAISNLLISRAMKSGKWKLCGLFVNHLSVWRQSVRFEWLMLLLLLLLGSPVWTANTFLRFLKASLAQVRCMHWKQTFSLSFIAFGTSEVYHSLSTTDLVLDLAQRFRIQLSIWKDDSIENPVGISQHLSSSIYYPVAC